MKKFLVVVCCWLCLAGALAANRDADLLSDFRRGGFQESELESILLQLADVSGPRLFGSPSLRRARDWAMHQFRRWGLQEVRLDLWGDPVPAWEVERCTLELVRPYYKNLVAFPRAWSPGLARVVQGRPVHVLLETEADFETYRGRLRSAVVLLGKPPKLQGNVSLQPQRFTGEQLEELLQPQPRGGEADREERRRRWEAAREWRRQVDQFLRDERVQAVIEPGLGGGGTVKVSGGSYAHPPLLPSLLLAPEHFGLLTRLVAADVPPELRLQLRTRSEGTPQPESNLFAEIPGADPTLREEVVLLGAHLDSWLSGTGASDNAAGCAVVMEAMRLLARFGQSPRRTIRAVLWSGEEQGLLGSRDWVSRNLAARDGQYPREHRLLSAYFNVDNGSGKIRGIYLQGNRDVEPVFAEMIVPLADLEVTTLSPRPTGSTDHVPFDRIGIPAFQFIQDPLAYDSLTHHSNLDLVEHTSLEDLQQASVVLAWFAWSTAMLDEPLPRKERPEAAP